MRRIWLRRSNSSIVRRITGRRVAQQPNGADLGGADGGRVHRIVAGGAELAALGSQRGALEEVARARGVGDARVDHLEVIVVAHVLLHIVGIFGDLAAIDELVVIPRIIRAAVVLGPAQDLLVGRQREMHRARLAVGDGRALQAAEA